MSLRKWTSLNYPNLRVYLLGHPDSQKPFDLDFHTAPVLKRTILEEDFSVIIDLAEVKYMDSTGLANLVIAAQKSDKFFALILPAKGEHAMQIYRIIQLTGVEDALRRYPTFQAAFSAYCDYNTIE